MEESVIKLIISYLNKSSTTEQRKELLDWLEQDESHQDYFRSIKDIYDLGQLDDLKAKSDVGEQWKKFNKEITIFSKRKLSKKMKISLQLLRYAAIFMIGVFSMLLLEKLIHSKLDTLTKIETGIGERAKINLPDGSHIWINADSYIEYSNSFNKEDRVVYLEGEAFFDVEKNVEKPFVVKTKDFKYKVLGTSFNVYSFGDENISNITLTEGSVLAEYNMYSKTLVPGDILEYDRSTESVSLKKDGTDQYISWRDGKLRFNNISLEDFSKRLERNYNTKFVFENERTRNQKLGGTIKNDESIETVLEIIERSIKINYRQSNDTIYIE